MIIIYQKRGIKREKIRKILACGHGDLNKGTDLVDLISFKINVIIKRLIELENIVKRIYKQKYT